MKKVLFIGNSHTYFNDMAAMFKVMCNKCKDIGDTHVTMLAHPYVTLDYHKGQKEVRFNILYGEYDYVVLQQGAHPFEGEEVLTNDAKEINKFIKEGNSIPVAYMTWAEKSKPENQTEMTKAYINMAKEIDGILAPVGMVFEKMRIHHPEIELYNEDGGHASKVGSYIAAATLCCSIFKINPMELSLNIEYKGKTLCNVNEKEGKIIKEYIEEVLKNISM